MHYCAVCEKCGEPFFSDRHTMRSRAHCGLWLTWRPNDAYMQPVKQNAPAVIGRQESSMMGIVPPDVEVRLIEGGYAILVSKTRAPVVIDLRKPDVQGQIDRGLSA